MKIKVVVHEAERGEALAAWNPGTLAAHCDGERRGPPALYLTVGQV